MLGGKKDEDEGESEDGLGDSNISENSESKNVVEEVKDIKEAKENLNGDSDK